MSSIMLAIKMGSTNTTIFKQNEGFTLIEPSLVAVTSTAHGKEIIAVGKNAKKLLSKTSDNIINVFSPISEGIIADTDMASAMLKEFVIKVCPKKIFKPNIRALVCVPLGISLTERLAFEKVCYNAGITDVVLVPSIICSAIGIGKDIASDKLSLIVGIGGGCTDIAIIGQNMLINGVNVGMGGQNIDHAIVQQILSTYNLVISDETAEKLKKEIGSLYINDLNEYEITGKDSETSETRSVIVTATDIYPAVEHYYSKICETILSLLATCSPDINAEISNSGIAFVGGDSKIPGIEKYYKAKLNLEVTSFLDAEDLEMIGASNLLSNPTSLKRLLINI